MNKQLEFVDKEMYYRKRLILELVSEKDNNFIVEISDFSIKDGAIQHDWIPYVGQFNDDGIFICNSGNPKYKKYDKEEFYKTFKIK